MAVAGLASFFCAAEFQFRDGLAARYCAGDRLLADPIDGDGTGQTRPRADASSAESRSRRQAVRKARNFGSPSIRFRQLVWSALPDGSLDFYQPSVGRKSASPWTIYKAPNGSTRFIRTSAREWTDQVAHRRGERDFLREHRTRPPGGRAISLVPEPWPSRCVTSSETSSNGTVPIADIEDQKRAEDALRESEQRFRDFTESASDWYWETGPDHRFIAHLVSEQLLDKIGVLPASRIGMLRWDFARDLEEEPEKWRLHMATLDAHQPFRDFRYRAASRDGSEVYIAVSGKPLFDSEGRFLGYRGVASADNCCGARGAAGGSPAGGEGGRRQYRP